jgi:hypothetical protein
VKVFKNILICFWIAYLFIGNIGVAVFKHYCEEDGVFTSYFINNQNHCSEETSKSTLPDCCKKEQPHKEQINEDCCSDDLQVVKVKLDFFDDDEIHQQITDIVTTPHIPFKIGFCAENNLAEVWHYVNPPPNKLGRKILIQHQVFRI